MSIALPTTRRAMVLGSLAAGLAACLPLDRTPNGRATAKLQIIARALGGTLGVQALDPAQGLAFGLNQDTRFAMASSFKTSLAGLVLLRSQRGELDLAARVLWTEDDVLGHAPFAREHLAQGATVLELARAAQTVSDNTAANLLLARVGGPAAVTALWRDLGDETSRLDRTEPQVNFVTEGDLRDTTTPAAMARTLSQMLFAGPLEEPARAQLRGWMTETRTGADRVRAGLPDSWVSGDKTGNSGEWPGMGYTRADIGYLLAPSGNPVLFAVYHRSFLSEPRDGALVDAAFKEIGREITGWVRRNYPIVLT